MSPVIWGRVSNTIIFRMWAPAYNGNEVSWCDNFFPTCQSITSYHAGSMRYCISVSRLGTVSVSFKNVGKSTGLKGVAVETSI